MLWNEQSIKEFWECNEASFAGDTNAKEVVRLSKKYIKGKVLDIGAGSGALMKLLPDSVGIDIVPKASNIIEASIDKLPFTDNTFDTIFCTDVLEHLPQEILNHGKSEMKRVLKSGGYLVAIVPNNEDLSENKVYCPYCKNTFHRWGHVKRFNKWIIYAYFTEVGLAVKEFKEIPLSLMAKNWIVRYFWCLFVWLKWIQKSDILVIVERL